MKWFTEPSGKFVIKVPIEWQYSNARANIPETSPYSFQLYTNPCGAFQISCYSAEEKPLNENVPKQKFDTNNLTFGEFRLADDGFNTQVWGATVEDHTIIAKYICDTKRASDPEVIAELKKAKEALSTVQLLSPGKRKLAHDLDKYEKFMASLFASFDLKVQAMENVSLIEFSIITANQIDAYLRLAIVMREQLDGKTDELDIKYLYQKETDEPIIERKIYKKAKLLGIIDKAIFSELNSLYSWRNKMVHRYIISEFRSRDLLDIGRRYEENCEKVRLILRGIEDQQFKEGVGIYGNGQHPHAKPTSDALRLLHSQVNDKHLTKDFEREITFTNAGDERRFL